MSAPQHRLPGSPRYYRLARARKVKLLMTAQGRRRALAEDRRADADVGGAAGDRRLEVGAHAHGEAGEPVARGEVGAAARSAAAGRRRPAGSPSARRPAGRRGRGRRRGSASSPSGSTPAFCGSRPVLTWTKSVGQAPRACTARGELAGEAVAVEAVDGVEEVERAGELVGLQRADEVQLDARGTPPGTAASGLRPPAPGSRRRPAGRRRAPRAPDRAAAPWRRRRASPRPAGRPAAASAAAMRARMSASGMAAPARGRTGKIAGRARARRKKKRRAEARLPLSPSRCGIRTPS